jgi:hypothetical protein
MVSKSSRLSTAAKFKSWRPPEDAGSRCLRRMPRDCTSLMALADMALDNSEKSVSQKSQIYKFSVRIGRNNRTERKVMHARSNSAMLPESDQTLKNPSYIFFTKTFKFGEIWHPCFMQSLAKLSFLLFCARLHFSFY